MSIVIRSNSLTQVFVHVGIVVLTFATILLLVFYNYLPFVTNHGETITVPSLVGVSVENIESKLKEAGFEMVVQDTIYSKDYQPYTIIDQKPVAGTKVKQGRKIYLIISPKNPPKVRMPKLEGLSYQMAIAKIKTMQLEVGAIRFKPDIAKDAILGQEINGRPVKENELVQVGTSVDLVVGSGVGDEEMDMPDLEGLSLEDAKSILETNGLQLGHITEDVNADQPAGIVTKQSPTARLEADDIPYYDSEGQPLTKRERDEMRRKKQASNPDGNNQPKKRYGKDEFDPRPRNKIRAGEIVDLTVSANRNAKPKEEEKK
ncbi:MAG: PASTA domain-containing protein [Raineya sp.]|jgi:beta-lactam-binding protein with PASTA domain|nr:PASTA domain-containing protein [Raineya sp.]